ncbi:hypothetical protein V6R85_24270 [Agrobacterium sp. CCNWLW32]|uniref:hypothetical protein n=1 Tax=Agrobacterium sp. CCNWLW32 TaxID=3122072 RepID=UPI0030104707
MLDNTDDFDLDTATKVGKLSASFELTKEQRRTVKDLMDRGRIAPDDSVILWLVIFSKMDGLSKIMSDDIRGAVLEMVEAFDGKLEGFTNAQIQTLRNEMLGLGKGLLKAAEDSWKDRLDDIIKQSRDSEDARIRKWNDDRDKLDFRKERDKHAIAYATAAALIIAAAGITWYVSKDIAHAESATSASFFSRSDAKENLTVMSNNNMTKVFAAFCLPEQRFVVNGQTKCKADLALDKPLLSTTGLDGLVALWREAVVKLGTWGLIGLGVVGTLLTQWTRRRLKKT